MTERLYPFFLACSILCSLASPVPAALAQADHADTVSTSPHSVYHFTQQDIARMPVRNIAEYVAQFPGVTRYNGFLHVRGGRNYDISHYLHGIPLTNRFFGTRALAFIPEVIGSYSLYTGGFGAPYGTSTGAMTVTTLRSGGDVLEASVNIHTDNFVRTGDEFLGTTSFGFRNTVATLGGPVPGIEQTRFFLAAENDYMRNPRPMFLDPMRFELTTDILDVRGPGGPLPAPVALERNHIPDLQAERNSIQGTVTSTFLPVQLTLAGSYQQMSDRSQAGWPTALTRTFNRGRIPTTEVESAFLSLTGQHSPADWLTLDVSASYFTRSEEIVDPDFGTDWKKYSDSIENAQRGYTGFFTRWQGPWPYSVIYGFSLEHENAPNNTFTRNDQRAWILTANGKASVSDLFNLRFGGDLEFWTMRLLDIRNVRGRMGWEFPTGGPRPFSSEQERRVTTARMGSINHYGYDVDGNPVEDGRDAPRTAFLASGFLENTIRQDDLLLTLGLRFEHYQPKLMGPEDAANPPMDWNLDVLDESMLVEQPSRSYLLPRVHVTYPASRTTTLFGSFGRYVQMPPLQLLYAGNTFISRTVSVISRGNAFNRPAGFYARPERSTQYEAGMRQIITPNLRFGASVFQKDILDQLAVRRLPEGFVALTNVDASSVTGLSLSLELLPYHGLSAGLHGTLTRARGTGSTPQSSVGRVEQYLPIDPIFAPLEYQPEYEATLLVRYRAPEETGGPVLSGVDLTVVASYKSGFPFTRLAPLQAIGSSNPWTIGVRQILDPRSAEPAEPLNNSVTPSIFNLDIRLGKEFAVGPVGIEVYGIVLNLLNTRHIVNVYPITGSTRDDGWLGSDLASFFNSTPMYREFYEAINIQNRWAYMRATGNDLYGSPRQIRFGVRALL